MGDVPKKVSSYRPKILSSECEYENSEAKPSPAKPINAVVVTWSMLIVTCSGEPGLRIHSRQLGMNPFGSIVSQHIRELLKFAKNCFTKITNSLLFIGMLVFLHTQGFSLCTQLFYIMLRCQVALHPCLDLGAYWRMFDGGTKK